MSQALHKCAVCKEAATKRCARCKSVWYCTVAHQREHWKTHKNNCNDSFQADQYTLHKKEFDRISKHYGLNSDEKAEEVSLFLTQNADVSAPAFAQKFGLKVEEAVVFLEWIKVGINFREKNIEAAKQSGFQRL